MSQIEYRITKSSCTSQFKWFRDLVKFNLLKELRFAGNSFDHFFGNVDVYLQTAIIGTWMSKAVPWLFLHLFLSRPFLDVLDPVKIATEPMHSVLPICYMEFFWLCEKFNTIQHFDKRIVSNTPSPRPLISSGANGMLIRNSYSSILCLYW